MITFEVDGVPICSWLDFEDDSENMKGDLDMTLNYFGPTDNHPNFGDKIEHYTDASPWFKKTMKELWGKSELDSGYFRPTDAYLKPYINYAKHDAKATSTMSYRDYKKKSKEENMTLNIKKVIFNGTATIVFWSDNTKTVVRCGIKDYYDTEKGLAMAIAKKFLGNKGSYYETFKKWIPNVNEMAVCADCKFGDSPEIGDGPCDKCSFSKDYPVGSKFVKAEN